MFTARAILATLGGFAPAFAWASAGMAQGACELAMTVQMQSCQVANYERCGNDWRITFSDGNGPFFISEIDSETRWTQSVSLDSGEVDTLSPEAASPASFSDLLASGRDDYDFKTQSQQSGYETRYTGYDALKGGAVTIDGVALERSEFAMKAYAEDGALMWTRAGTQYVSRDMRLFFSDAEMFENAAGDKVDSAGAPASFAFPGEEGFGSETPEVDCDMLMTGDVARGGQS
jgi:hypothetical protein